MENWILLTNRPWEWGWGAGSLEGACELVRAADRGSQGDLICRSLGGPQAAAGAVESDFSVTVSESGWPCSLIVWLLSCTTYGLQPLGRWLEFENSSTYRGSGSRRSAVRRRGALQCDVPLWRRKGRGWRDSRGKGHPHGYPALSQGLAEPLRFVFFYTRWQRLNTALSSAQCGYRGLFLTPRFLQPAELPQSVCAHLRPPFPWT